MNENSPSEYSVWLVPEAESSEYRQLQAAIVELADVYEDAPVFEPHVTVVGGVTGERAALVEMTRELAAGAGPIEATFRDVRCSTTAHQCVFRLVDPSLPLFELHESARDALGLSESAYNPHMSLVYSEMRLPERLALADAVDVDALPDVVQLSTLVLVKTTGPVTEWERVFAVEL